MKNELIKSIEDIFSLDVDYFSTNMSKKEVEIINNSKYKVETSNEWTAANGEIWVWVNVTKRETGDKKK